MIRRTVSTFCDNRCLRELKKFDLQLKAKYGKGRGIRGRAEKKEKIQSLWETIQVNKPGPKSLSAVITMMNKSGGEINAVRLFENHTNPTQDNTLFISPDYSCCLALSQSLCSFGDYKSLLKIQRYLKFKKTTIDPEVFPILILRAISSSGNTREKNYRAAVRVLQHANLEVGEVSLILLLTVLEMAPSVEELLKMTKYIVKIKSAPPDDSLMGIAVRKRKDEIKEINKKINISIVRTCAKIVRQTRITLVERDLRAPFIIPTKIREQILSVAESSYKVLSRDGDKEMARLYAALGMCRKVERLFATNPVRELTDYTTVLSSYTYSHKPLASRDKAIGTWEAAIQNGFDHNSVIWKSLLSFYAEAAVPESEIDEYLSKMAQHGQYTNRVSIKNILQRYYSRVGNLKKAAIMQTELIALRNSLPNPKLPKIISDCHF